MSERNRLYPQIGVRVPPAMRDEFRDAAVRLGHESEAAMIREATRRYIDLRDRLGVQFEPIVSALLSTPFRTDRLLAAILASDNGIEEQAA